VSAPAPIPPSDRKRLPRAKHALTAKQEAYLSARTVQGNMVVPVKVAGIMRAAYSGRPLSKIVKAMCLHCYCYEDVADVGTCTDETCPLWRVRPYQGKKEKAT
jgi:hypothetical protein